MMLLGLFFCALASAQLRVTLESDVFTLNSQSNAFPVIVTVTNDYQTPVTICKWDSPLDDAYDVLRADMFEVVHSSGTQATYTGIVMKRYPVLSDFSTMSPGQSMTVVLDLFKGYYFPSEGEYKVRLATAIKIHEGEFEGDSIRESYGAFAIKFLGSNAIHVDVKSLKPAPVWGAPLQTNLTGPSPKSNCDASRTSQINLAGSNAISASQRGFNYLSPSTCTSLASYVTWFGTCTGGASRYNTVKNALSAINTGLKGTYPVDCNGARCTPNTYAYVFPNERSHEVFVCGAFWRVSSNNCVMDSQPGTLIHEMGHFTDVASLADVTYGIEPCKKLAQDNPASAVTNADNYCFYTDSCP